MTCARRRCRAAAFPLVRPSWANIGISPGRCGRAPVADITLSELRDQLAFTLGSLMELATMPVGRAQMTADPETVALFGDLARLGAELAQVAETFVAGDELPSPGDGYDGIAHG